MRDTVRRVVSSVLGVPEDDINESTGPDTIEAWDSLQHMNLILALEEELGVQFSDDDIVSMLDVGTIYEKAEALVAAK
ncbi:MAG: acyl carrier protein [Gemmatimonadota bacterium]